MPGRGRSGSGPTTPKAGTARLAMVWLVDVGVGPLAAHSEQVAPSGRVAGRTHVAAHRP